MGQIMKRACLSARAYSLSTCSPVKNNIILFNTNSPFFIVHLDTFAALPNLQNITLLIRC